MTWTHDLPSAEGKYVRIHDGVWMLIDIELLDGKPVFYWGGKPVYVRDDGSWWFKLPEVHPLGG